MKLTYCLLALLCLSGKGFGQGDGATRPLDIGDTVPGIVFTHVYGHPGSTLPLSSFHNKIILLDFWASWCGSCIALFPHLDSLQQKFGDQIQVILFNTHSKISHDDEARIKKVFDGVEKRTGKKINLPVIYDSERLDQLFPCKGVPHEVWLDHTHKVIAITFAIEVTEKNIAAILANQPVKFHKKVDVLNFDSTEALFVNNNGGSGDNFIGRSILTGYREGLGGTVLRDAPGEPGKVTGMSVLNASLPMLVQTAYAGTGKTDNPRNRLILDLNNKDRWYLKLDSDYYRYAYCYDIACPPASQDELHEYLRQDIYRYFHITVRTEKRMLSCSVLTLAPGKKLTMARKGIQDTDYGDETLNKYLHHYPLPGVFDFFNRRCKHPVLNETGLPGNITLDIDLPFDLDDEPAMLRCLKKAGFTVTRQLRELPITIITDKRDIATIPIHHKNKSPK